MGQLSREQIGEIKQEEKARRIRSKEKKMDSMMENRWILRRRFRDLRQRNEKNGVFLFIFFFFFFNRKPHGRERDLLSSETRAARAARADGVPLETGRIGSALAISLSFCPLSRYAYI